MKISGILNVLLAVAVGVLAVNLYNRESAENEGEQTAIENIMTRTSIRSYTDKAVDAATVETLLRAGMAAPTAKNQQPWDFMVVRDRALLQSLADSLPYAKMTAGAPLAIVVCGNLQKSLPGVSASSWIMDTSAATENILLAAHSLGLGAVWTGVHPYPDTGHRIYTAMLARALPVLLKTGTAGAAKLPAPMLATNWENTTSVSLDAPGIKLSGPAKQLPGTNSIARSFAGRMPKIWKLEPGSTIEFKFRGTKAMLYDLYGPDTPYYEVEIDGKAREMRRFDGYCTYHRLALCGLADNLPDAVHTVKITVLPKKIDRREILFERNRADFDKNPDKYAPLNGYAGQLFLVGELVK